MAAIRTAKALQDVDRAATADEQSTLAQWSSWGAIPQVFDEQNEDWSAQRTELKELLSDREWDQARRTTINAHYTSPAVVAEVWRALDQLGFDGGRVLEPGSGSGTFIGLAPAAATMTGVELDETTAAIAAALYPQAEIRAESFADTRIREGEFDAAVGNVPFANVRLHDPLHNAGGHSMHNHFIVKSLRAVRPGGMVAVLTSSWTLDAANPSARREMNTLADLVGAVRLPSGAFRRSAGTEAVTDLLIFRRREIGEPRADLTWETVSARVVDGQNTKVNAYFDLHPEHILGELRMSSGGGMYGADNLQVISPDLAALPVQLRGALDDVVRRATARGQLFTPRTVAVADVAPAARTDLWDGTIVAVDGGFATADGGELKPLSVPRAHGPEMRALIALRDGARELLETEAAQREDTPELDALRDGVRRQYDEYVERFGPINRFSLRRTGRYEKVADPATGQPAIDPDTGELVKGDDIMARVMPRAVAMFRTDPFSPLVRALEVFDDEEQTAVHAGVLAGRVVAPRQAAMGAETPAEAIAICLDQRGQLDLDTIATLLGTDPADARRQLGTQVFDDPETGELVHAPAYLSGNVRVKLEAAEAALEEGRDEFRVNVDALRPVIPAPIGVEDIQARMGAVWIPAEVHEQFLRELLNDQSVRVINTLPGRWEVKGREWGVQATKDWGTDRYPATRVAAAVMEQRQIAVKDTVRLGDGRERQELNPVETTAALEKAEQLQERFGAWIWEDPERATKLAAAYNRAFNSIRLRGYDDVGQYLTFPGLSESISLRPHQRTAVARMIAEPTVGLFHGVGAGKTLEMISGAMEMKRMGLVKKPCIVVPNHMLEQFSREWLQAYPQAMILAAGTDELRGDGRRMFVARAAANEWDGIVLTQTAFEMLPVSREARLGYVDREVAKMRVALDEAREADARSIKSLEKSVLSFEQQLKKRLDKARDPGITFEATGVDYLMVDEAHMYKNLATVSNIQGAAIAGSERATDLHMKLELLRERNGARIATLATATPLANSVTEANVMLRYLRPDLLEEAGVTSFDGWAATFGQQVTEMEMGPAGGFRLKERFARFQNVPEMLKMWHVFADVKTPDDLDLPVPAVAARPSDGKREVETIVLQPTPSLESFVETLGERAEAIAARKVSPKDDNMLLVSSHGRTAALDMRALDEGATPDGPVKLDAVAQTIFAEWQRTHDNEYLDETGQPSTVRGGMQMVFCDLSVPSDRRWNAYGELKKQLHEAGMPEGSVRFIHEARNNTEKARLFAAARAGHIAVLIGSTERMGMGTNVQSRITALHHIDCPWRPADLEQRDGRAIRQGNQNDEVKLFRYVVERTFDAYSWQTIGRKARFIAQVMKGKLDSREIEDIGDTAMSAAEAKALASGNPLLLEKANADQALQKLRRQEVAHRNAQNALKYTREANDRAIADHERALGQLAAARARTVDVSGDAFVMTVDGQQYRSRTDAAEAVGAWARAHQLELVRATIDRPIELGALGGHRLQVSAQMTDVAPFQRELRLRVMLEDVPLASSLFKEGEVTNAGIGFVRSLENRVVGIPTSETGVNKALEDAQRAKADAEERLGKPFPHAEALESARERSQGLDAILRQQSRPAAAAQSDASAPSYTAPAAAPSTGTRMR